MQTCTDHVDLVFVHEDSDAHQEREQEFVLLKQAPAHVRVQTERKVVVDVINSLFQVI